MIWELIQEGDEGHALDLCPSPHWPPAVYRHEQNGTDRPGCTSYASLGFAPPESRGGAATKREGARMQENRIRVAPHTVAYADGEKNRLIVEFAIPGAPTDTIDLKLLPDSVHLTAPAKDIEYVSGLALAWPVKPDKAEATYEHGLLRIEVPFKDPMEDAVKVAITTGATEATVKEIKA
jgi:HSP20 family molecular chaperone IbpA